MIYARWMQVLVRLARMCDRVMTHHIFTVSCRSGPKLAYVMSRIVSAARADEKEKGGACLYGM